MLDVAVLAAKTACIGLPGYVGHAWDMLKDSVRPGYGCAWQEYLAGAVVFDTVHNLTTAHRLLHFRGALVSTVTMGIPMTGDTMFHGTRLVMMVPAAEVPPEAYATVLPDEPQE